MARIRSIKPEFPQSESMGRVSRDARLCFILLWTLADDAGRLRGNSRMLASLLYPYDDDAGDLINGWLDELEAQACVRRYRIGSDHYLAIVEWKKHQRIDKPSESKIPPPPHPLPPNSGNGSGGCQEDFTNPREASANVPGGLLVGLDRKGEEGKGKEKNTPPPKNVTRRRVNGASPGFEAFWGSWPKSNRKGGKAECIALWEKAGLEIEAPTIVEHVEAMAKTEDWVKQAGQFIPAPVVYLRGRRWDGAELSRAVNDEGRAWCETRQGVIEHAVSIGLPPFDAVAERLRTGPSWSRYRADVIATDNQHHRRHA